MLIKRPVPDWEQNKLWEHSRSLRVTYTHKHTHSSSHSHGDDVYLTVGDKKHSRHRSGDEKYEFVRRRSKSRSKSPGLLVWMAGGRPS